MDIALAALLVSLVVVMWRRSQRATTPEESPMSDLVTKELPPHMRHDPRVRAATAVLDRPSLRS